LAGLFAGGPLSRGHAGSDGGALSLEYERFAHKTARTWFTIRVRQPGEREVSIRLGPDFPRSFDIEALDPRPARSSAGASGLEYVFTPAKGELVVHIGARPKRFGIASLSVEAEGVGAVDARQVIYP